MLGLLLTIYIVPMVLVVTKGKTKTDSLQSFKMTTNKGASLIIGGLGGAFSGFCLYGSTIARQTGTMTTGVFGILFLLSVFILLLAAPGFYDNEVRDSTLYARRYFFIKKKLPIFEISHCIIHANEMGGSIRVYAKNKKRPFCWIDLMQDNIYNFAKRVEMENIELRDASGEIVSAETLKPAEDEEEAE